MSTSEEELVRTIEDALTFAYFEDDKLVWREDWRGGPSAGAMRSGQRYHARLVAAALAESAARSLVERPHTPEVAPKADGAWGVFCSACSAVEGDYVYPCRRGWAEPIPPAVLVTSDVQREAWVKQHADEIEALRTLVDSVAPGDATLEYGLENEYWRPARDALDRIQTGQETWS